MSSAQIDLTSILNSWTKEISKGIHKAQDELGKEGAQKLQVNSPKRSGKRGGGYAKGWASKKNGTGVVVYNKDNYQLTHLLEFGHALRNGDRTAPQPHIGPVEEDLVTEYEKRVREVIDNA